MDNIEILNDRLIERFGRLLDGRGRFRLSFSDTQTEKKFGEFTDFYGSVIVRVVKELREVKKYPYLNPPCWVLEKLVFYRNSEVPTASFQGSYECVWAFRDAKGNPLPPNERVLDVIMWHVMNPTKRYDSDFQADKAAQDAEEIGKFMDTLDNEGRAPWASFENAVNVSTNQLEFRRNRTNG